MNKRSYIRGVKMAEKLHIHSGHKERVDAIKNLMPKEERLYELAELYKVFGDTTRIRILFALYEGEMCVCGIAELLNMTQSAISHQLRVLKNSKLVKFRKEGKTVFYSLDDDHIFKILSQGLEHISE